MKNLGDHGWLNGYIGIPYVPGGRDEEGYDCYGLCKAIYWDIFGQDLPDWQEDLTNVPIRARLIEGVISSGEFTDLEEPTEGCFVICYRTKAAYHIGLYFAGGVIHCIGGCGVIYEPLSRFSNRFTKITFGDWHI